MADYIDREELLKVLDRNSIYKKITYGDGRSIEEIIKSMPTVDTERHGHFIEKKDKDCNIIKYVCSECGYPECSYPVKSRIRYCPYCGAKMDEVTE